MRTIVIALLACTAPGCSKKQEHQPELRAPARSLELELAIYTAATEERIAADRAALEHALLGLGWRVEAMTAEVSEDPLPPEVLEHDLEPTEAAAARATTHLLGLRLRARSTRVHRLVTGAEMVVGEAADRLSGFVLDQKSWTIHTPEAWSSIRRSWEGDVPFASQHFTVRYERGLEGERLVTNGLARFGLPELLVEGSTPGEKDRVTWLINVVAQLLIEARELPAELAVAVRRVEQDDARKAFAEKLKVGAGSLTVRLERAERIGTDPDAEIKRIALPAGGAALAAALDQIFGSDPDPIRDAPSDSPDWTAAAMASRAALAALEPRVKRGLGDKESLFVKAAFRSGGSVEWMWVDVLRWTDAGLEGRLANKPGLVDGFALGQDVIVELSDVVDYRFRAADGTETGDLTRDL